MNIKLPNLYYTVKVTPKYYLQWCKEFDEEPSIEGFKGWAVDNFYHRVQYESPDRKDFKVKIK